MSQRRGPRRDIQASQRIMQQGRRGLLDPWEGGPVPGNQQSNLAAQTALLAQLVNPGTQAALTDSLLNTLLGRPEVNQLQSILALNASQRVGQQLGGDLQPSFGGMNRNRLYDEGMRGPRPLLPKRLPDRKKATAPPRNRMSRPANKTGDKSDKKDDANEAKEESGSGTRVNHKEDTKRDDGKPRKRKLDDVEDSDDEDGGPYSGIPSDHFYCHVCEKRMWDDKSFSNHIKGRAHLGLMELRDELYKIQVDLMRHEVQLAEALRNIEMDRIRRRGKNLRAITQEYCTMCDLHFFGNIVAHRKHESHQALKKFLHPCCTPCGKEFHTRIEWDEHKLTPDHMKKCPEGGDDMKLDTIELDDFELDDKVKEEILADTPEEGASYLNIRRIVPKYNPDAGFALKMVVPATGFECAMCKSFFPDEETVSVHCRTKTHFYNYVAYEKRKAKRASRETKPAKKARRDQETKVEPTESEEGVDKAETSTELDDSMNKTLNTTTGDTIILEKDESIDTAMEDVETAEESDSEGQKNEKKKE
ncbi:zinc finger protein on ecdysone puffs [Anabrus simplex]|uniref:zinc finger protein on ecdysone puffs n=1 Tax=Anabrus simplex TaxID=316456 RepID=UPI0035A275B4